MYSMVFLLVLASKISFQGMSNCDTAQHSQHDHTHKGYAMRNKIEWK